MDVTKKSDPFNKEYHAKLLVELGRNLEKCRKKHELTQEGIAEKLGISKSTYNRYENGNLEISSIKLKQLADLFSVSIDALFNNRTAHEKSRIIETNYDLLQSNEFFMYYNSRKQHNRIIKSLLLSGNDTHNTVYLLNDLRSFDDRDSYKYRYHGKINIEAPDYVQYLILKNIDSKERLFFTFLNSFSNNRVTCGFCSALSDEGNPICFKVLLSSKQLSESIISEILTIGSDDYDNLTNYNAFTIKRELLSKMKEHW